jgi:hypothetical protein
MPSMLGITMYQSELIQFGCMQKATNKLTDRRLPCPGKLVGMTVSNSYLVAY